MADMEVQTLRHACWLLPRFFAALRMTTPDPSVILRSEATKNLTGWPIAAFSQERLRTRNAPTFSRGFDGTRALQCAGLLLASTPGEAP